MKYCSKCDTTKPFSEFYRDKSRKDGFQSKCKECDSNLSARWFKKNHARATENIKKWREDNKAFLDEYYKKYYKDNLAAYAFSDFVSRINKSRDEVSAEYGVSVDDIISETTWVYNERERLTALTGITYHVDHIVPVALGGLHRASNLQLLPEYAHIEKTTTDNEVIKATKGAE